MVNGGRTILSFQFITDETKLAAVVEDAERESGVALDLEANGFHRYPERICLIQLSFSGDVYLIDPIEIDDVSSLGRLLADESVEKVFHSADYDMRSLDREWGFHVRRLFDTSIAAAFTGMTHLGLGTVVEEVLGITLPKSKKLQRSDWTRRPLSAEALTYASEDVRHLLKLRDVLGERLDGLGRGEWVAQESSRLAGVRHRPADPETAFLAIKGSRVLDGRGLALLKALHSFRDREAVRLDRPPFKVMPNEALLALAAKPETHLAAVKGLGRYARPPGAAGVRKAVEEGMRSAPVQRPRRARTGRPRLPRAQGAAATRRLVALREWRMKLGEGLKLDPALLWPMASLERLSAAPDSLDAEMDAPELRPWQRDEFTEALRRLLSNPSFGEEQNAREE